MRLTPLLALLALTFAGCATAPPVPTPPVNPSPTATSTAAPSRFALPATDDGLPGAGPIRRYPWFQKLWTDRRTTWADQIAQDQRAVVFLGDSITQGWKESLATSFPGVKVANRGISGDTTRGVLLRLREDVLSLNPSAVVLLIGTNDLEENATPWTVAANLRLILAALSAHDPALPVVLCAVMPSSATKKRPAFLIRRVNQLLLEATLDQPQVTFLDTWKLFADAQNDALPAEFPDLLHPNTAGYTKFAAALRPVFATLGFTEREPDTFTPEPGFVSLFNGRDLTGWGYRPSTDGDLATVRRIQAADIAAPHWPIVKDPVAFDGLTASPDARFVAKNGRLVVMTPPGGRRVQQLWTTREFPKNFVLKLEFRATPNADSGIYVRGPQLQCRDYLLAGPYSKLQRYRARDWNEIVITVTDGVAVSTCNGEILEAAQKVPFTGPIGLEGDRGQMEYRRIRLQERP
jgi:lysophospholipase L1-like esterase